MHSVEKVAVRELTATEIKQVSGGGYIGNTTPFILFNTPPRCPKPLQG